ncbi:hypothetical protein K227x_44480 [Rubripirellula lacrimiformis]|uniref:Uncharacterized protein n=1 Tax=Rubripirellula lacrimiformis TaxID=1930273 RepID=A0A517NG08_9BACT|nr:hypothetical protein K227x_44480 [Rubripirellula lacrimiformis]
MHRTYAPTGAVMHHTYAPTGAVMHHPYDPTGAVMHHVYDPTGAVMHHVCDPIAQSFHRVGIAPCVHVQETRGPLGMRLNDRCGHAPHVRPGAPHRFTAWASPRASTCRKRAARWACG